jgi:hypothetical protein
MLPNARLNVIGCYQVLASDTQVTGGDDKHYEKEHE